jgi:hypothetical protein
MLIPLHYWDKFIGVLTIFQAELNIEILWAGRIDSNRHQELPSLSFEVWSKERKGLAPA